MLVHEADAHLRFDPTLVVRPRYGTTAFEAIK